MIQMSSLILGQYKVIRVLRMQEDYAAVLAVDILDRMQTVRLLNIYEGKAARRYAAVFNSIRHCQEFIGTRLLGESLIAVFSWREAPLIDTVFNGNSKQDWRTRLDYAEMLFHLVLNLWDQPSELGCAALLSENLCVSVKDRRMFSNFCITPTDLTLPQRELVCLASDHAKKILFQNWKTELPERRFMFDLVHGRWKDAIQLNSAWNVARVQIEEAYEARAKKLFIVRNISLLFMNMKWNREVKRRTYGKSK